MDPSGTDPKRLHRSRNLHMTENQTEKYQPRPASILTKVTPIKCSGPRIYKRERHGSRRGSKGMREDNGDNMVKVHYMYLYVHYIYLEMYINDKSNYKSNFLN